MSFQLSSPAFAAGGAIPGKYSCLGSGVSPALAWNEAPAGTKSFALIMEDPDASTGAFVHWVIYNLPAEARALPEGIAARADLPDGSLNGKNSAARFGYTGPCPPSGTHRYFFRLYALSAVLDLPAGAEKNQLVVAMQDHVLGTAELMGTFAR